MPLLDTLIGIIAPFTCLGCGVEENRLLCEACEQSLATVPSRCYRCKAVTDEYAVCNDCKPATPLRQVVVYAHYQGIAKEMVHRMKYERAQAGVREAARLLSCKLIYVPADGVLTHVPTATSRVRTRGYDHARLLARHLAIDGNLPHRTLLSRVGQAHQVGSTRAARIRQLADAFRPLHTSNIRGKHVVLVDDVLTTGATLETTARVLKRAGAKTVSALVFAQA